MAGLSTPVQGVHLRKGGISHRGLSNSLNARFKITYRLKTYLEMKQHHTIIHSGGNIGVIFLSFFLEQDGFFVSVVPNYIETLHVSDHVHSDM